MLLDEVRQALRLVHYSDRTEKAHIGWIRRFILFHDKRHPSKMGASEVRRFLSHLASDGQVSVTCRVSSDQSFLENSALRVNF
jgi:hypothetical protein